MILGLVNIGSAHVGDLSGSVLEGDALLCEDGVMTWVGDTADVAAADVDQLVDVAGASVVPGFIDSHVHVAFGDYTPRQRTVGFLESYLHGGVTRAISASEVHVPGRPTDPSGVKALAVAAERAYRHYRPGGVTVHAGSVILEPGLTDTDFQELRREGVWLAKAGFGAFPRARDYVQVVRAAQDAGLTVMCHVGGGSIRGTQDVIDAQTLLAMHPDVLGHVNGGPTSLDDAGTRALVEDGGDMALQLVQAGNLRSAIHISSVALEAGCPQRLLIASDTPTGTGVIPLALLRTMAELVSLGPLSPELALAAVTGNVAAVYGLGAGTLTLGSPADLLVLDAPVGSRADDWQQALRLGDLPSVAVAATSGEVRFAGSRNTPPPQRDVRLTRGSPMAMPW